MYILRQMAISQTRYHLNFSEKKNKIEEADKVKV